MENDFDSSIVWNKVAALYESKFMDVSIYNETYTAFCDLIGKEAPAILEIGCGPGNITKYLLSKRPDFKILGLDIASNMIALAAKNNPLASFKTMDCRTISTLNTHFNGIISGFCIPYLSTKECMQFFEDCYDLLETNGAFYMSYVAGLSSESGYKEGSSGDKIYFYYHEAGNIEKALVKLGFSIRQNYKVDYDTSDGAIEIHNVLICQKLDENCD